MTSQRSVSTPLMAAVTATTAVVALLALLVQVLNVASGSRNGAEGAVTGLDREVRRVMRQAEELRGLRLPADSRYRVVGRREGLEDRLREASVDPEELVELEADERLLERLGLLPPGTDLRELVIEAMTGEIAGYYDPETDELTIIDEDGLLGEEELAVVAHEHGHALADRRWDLVTLQEAAERRESAAVDALIEGDATLLMTQWMLAHTALAQIADEAPLDLPADESVLADVPAVLARSFTFPYIDGLAFLMGSWGRGGWPAVDAIWDDPPVSTEQVMHPALYPEHRPVDVRLPPLVARLGPGWSVSAEEVMGEMQTGIWVALGEPWDPLDFSLTGQHLPHDEAAAGWGGDRLISLDGPDGAWAVVWGTAWDSPADAREFAARAMEVTANLPGSHAVLAGRSAQGTLRNPVLVVLADGPATQEQVFEALATSPELEPADGERGPA